MQTRELNNGRLAMIGIAGFVVQELVNGREIFEHLLISLEREVSAGLLVGGRVVGGGVAAGRSMDAVDCLLAAAPAPLLLPALSLTTALVPLPPPLPLSLQVIMEVDALVPGANFPVPVVPGL